MHIIITKLKLKSWCSYSLYNDELQFPYDDRIFKIIKIYFRSLPIDFIITYYDCLAVSQWAPRHHVSRTNLESVVEHAQLCTFFSIVALTMNFRGYFSHCHFTVHLRKSVSRYKQINDAYKPVVSTYTRIKTENDQINK